MLNMNETKLQQIAQAAFDKVGGNRRWQNAVARALQILRDNPYWHLLADGTFLLLSDSNEIYEVTARGCTCKASRQGQPCKHRAARQLAIRYAQASH